MTTTRNVTAPPVPLTGTAFVRFALDVVDLLRQSEPDGLDRNSFLQLYFTSNPPMAPQIGNHWWNEFKRAVDYSKRHFEAGDDPWAWIRALPGDQQGQYFYHVVAIRDASTRAQVVEFAASLERLEPFTTRRWLTQTRSRMRVRAAQGLALVEEGRRTGDAHLERRGQAVLDEFTMLSPRLAAINFDTGLVTEDLFNLAQSSNPRIQRLVGPQIRRALQSARRLERDVSAVAEQTLRLAQVYQLGSPQNMP
jgi:hypothetical protein